MQVATSPLSLLLADGRLPTGGHVHSVGIEQAIDDGRVHDVGSLAAWLAAYVATTGRVEATCAAAAAHETTGRSAHGWPTLVVESDARTPVPALRTLSRTRGRQLLRLARGLVGAVGADPARLDDVVDAAGGELPLPLATGAVVAVLGGSAHDAALQQVYGAAAEASQAAVRLLGLDPAALAAVLAHTAVGLGPLAAEAADHAAGDPPGWPADGAPVLELAAAVHAARADRYFES
ncbi:MAG: hypothetical protein JJT89_12410 [Nitriliruptoraceae bacterium]|nr:hypothetical protein [Nitriliruptoraceae bacterium]